MSALGISRNVTITKLFTGIVVVISFTWAATASASVRSCSYRNLTYGLVPYVTRATTNLTSAAVDGANVCEIVSEVVTRVQLRRRSSRPTCTGRSAIISYIRGDGHIQAAPSTIRICM
jgi:hypothetical protein